MDFSWLTSEVVINILWILIFVGIVGIADEIMKPARVVKKKHDGHWEWIPDKSIGAQTRVRIRKTRQRRKGAPTK